MIQAKYFQYLRKNVTLTTKTFENRTASHKGLLAKQMIPFKSYASDVTT